MQLALGRAVVTDKRRDIDELSLDLVDGQVLPCAKGAIFRPERRDCFLPLADCRAPGNPLFVHGPRNAAPENYQSLLALGKN